MKCLLIALSKKQVFAALVLAAVMHPQQILSQAASDTSESVISKPELHPARTIRIGAGDLLEISVFDVPELTQPARVSASGDVKLNLIGSIHLQGLSPDEAGELVAKKLKEEEYVINPDVSVLIREYGTQGISVLGEVKRPGVYQVLGKRNLVDVLSEAGGLTPVAAPQATIRRQSGERLVMSLSNNPNELLATNVELLPGDTVIVPRAGIVYVLGEVGRPGGFVMQNNGKLTVLQSIAYAGGTIPTASLSKVKIIRKTQTGYEEIRVDLKKLYKGKDNDFELHAEDIVYVPTSGTKSILFGRTPALLQAAASAAVYRGIE